MGCFPAFVTTPSGFACHPSDGGEFSLAAPLLNSPPLEGCPAWAGWLLPAAVNESYYYTGVTSILYQKTFVKELIPNVPESLNPSP